jgi:sugar/nucleoside kinase (ribokinase family)
MARIVSLGSAIQDIYLSDKEDFLADSFVDRSILGRLTVGSKIDIDHIDYNIGGGGTNSATSFARHGHQSIIIGNIGRDMAGNAVLDSLDEEGIDSSYITYSRAKTGCSIILLDIKTGERTILTHRGASAKFNNLNPDDLDLILPDWLYISSLSGDLDTLRAFVKKAKSLNCKVMLNPGKPEIAQKQRLLRILNEIDAVLVNQDEAKTLVPGQILSELLSHLSCYTKTAIITAGSMGGIATNGKEAYRFGIYEDVKVKDTTGAGDAFGSGLLAHLAAGYSFKESLIFASANSTSVVNHLGAHSGVLTGSEDLHPMPIQHI